MQINYITFIAPDPKNLPILLLRTIIALYFIPVAYVQGYDDTGTSTILQTVTSQETVTACH
jgi:hypothetical protein